VSPAPLPEPIQPPPFAEAITALHAAMAKVANGDTAAIRALYSHSDDATSFYGWGGYEKGWAAVAQRWDWAGEQFKGGTVAYRNVTCVVGTELAYTTDIETFTVKMAGLEQAAQWSNRVTHVFRLEEGAWRLLHRHANRLEDQFEPSTRLQGGGSRST
jgi:ketosteroid isomerase-like protein